MRAWIAPEIPGPSSQTSRQTRPPPQCGAHADGVARAALFDGLLGILEQIHQDLLQLPEIPFDGWQPLLLFDDQAEAISGKREPLQFHGAIHHIIQGNTAALRERFAGNDEQLPKYIRGTLGLLQDVLYEGGTGSIAFLRAQPLRVHQNGGQGVAQFMDNPADALPGGH